ncbi:MAG: nucleoid-associated protein [Chitinophagaceae bacterium]|jgi:nucleoid-associated protein|nr:nucleoid-associated protein [Chitinophagaceae bacterium]
MTLQRIIVHELRKNSGTQSTNLNVSNNLLPVDNQAIELIDTLLKSYSGDKILYAEFDNNPGRYFPERFTNYCNSHRSDEDYIQFTIDLIGNLETIIKNKVLAKGGYLVFAEYVANGITFNAIFLIRDTEGKVIDKTTNSFEIKKVEYLDTNHLAMACKINESKKAAGEQNYLSFTKLKQLNLSDYFTDWICVLQLESSTEFTNSLYRIINNLPFPINPETNRNLSIDEVRNMVYANATSNVQRNINIKILSEQIYGDENVIPNYAEDNQISIDTEFRYDAKVLRKFIQINVIKDGINLKFSRGDSETKVRLSDEDPNLVIIESEQFANALREQL